MIANLATTKMSSKGQVVIPETIRKTLGLENGCQFLVLGEKDAVILKTITAPSKKEFQDLVNSARKAAKKAGLKPKDVFGAVAQARGKK
jgi:AbrB family looped-hinge helix DNA binding protein